MPMRIAGLLLLTLVFSGCVNMDEEAEDLVDSLQRGPTCTLFDNSLSRILCIQYSLGTGSVSSSCNTEESNYAPEGATTNSTTSDGSSFGCSTTGLSGRCTVSGQIYHYYSSEFSVGQAQSDCTSLGGTFQ